MKKTQCVMLVIFLICFLMIQKKVYGAAKSNDYRKIEFDIQNSNSQDEERFIPYPIVEAVLDDSMRQIDVTLCNVGTAEICVVNSENVVVDSIVVNADEEVCVTLDVGPLRGYGRVLVLSSKWYAKGQFLL